LVCGNEIASVIEDLQPDWGGIYVVDGLREWKRGADG
jgi:hypothetical protein